MVAYTTALNLKEMSPIDDKWNYLKSASEQVSRMLSEGDNIKHSERIANCSNTLTFNLKTNPDGEQKLKLKCVHLCHVRVCPICMVCKTRVDRAKLFGCIEQIEKNYPTTNYLLLTLTLKNCLLKNLRNILKDMSISWQRFLKLKLVKKVVLGCFRSLEITKSKDYNAHPHYHVLIAVKPSYFSHNYLTQANWTELWKCALRIDYTPIVDVRRVDNYHLKLNKIENLKKGIKEVAKYITKVPDLIGKGTKLDTEFLEEYNNQVANIKKNNLSGIFKEFMNEEEATEEEILKASSDNDNEDELVNDRAISFVWFSGTKNYATLYA